MSYEEDYEAQRKFLPEVIDICGTQLARRIFKEAPPEEDMKHNTDFVLQDNANGMRIACRLRTYYPYWCKYPDEFTIRSVRRAGKTELRKIIEGWGTYNFYGFRSEDDSTIHAWMIGDLNVFRSWHSDQIWRTHKLPGIEQPNGDGSSKFRAYRIGDLPADFVVARYRPALDDELPF